MGIHSKFGFVKKGAPKGTQKVASVNYPQIFKMQRSIITSHENTRILIYNERRSIMGEYDATKVDMDLMGNDLKIYVYGVFENKTGKVLISDYAPKQGW